MTSNLAILARDFCKTLTHPSPSTFTAVASHAHGRLTLSLGIATLFGEMALIAALVLSQNSWVSILVYALQSLPVIPLLVLLWAFSIYKVCQTLFHRKKIDYEAILYILAIILIIFQLFLLISVALNPVSIPAADGVGWAGAALGLVLAVLALSAMARLSTWQSILTVLISALLSALGGFFLVLFFGAILRTVPWIR